MDCTIHGVAKSQTRLSDFHFHLSLSYTHSCLEENRVDYTVNSLIPESEDPWVEGMATQPSIFAWRIP